MKRIRVSHPNMMVVDAGGYYYHADITIALDKRARDKT
jgi:hypothetical protein